MSQDRNIVHQYFKHIGGDTVILVKVNPVQFRGTELTIFGDGKKSRRDLDFDEEILDDLLADGFEPSSALEFNLYQAGLV